MMTFPSILGDRYWPENVGSMTHRLMMKGLELARRLATERFSGLSLRYRRQKNKWVSALSVIRATTNEWRHRVLFYALPVKKSVDLKPVLSEKELQRIRPRLQKAIEWQTVTEEASRNLKQFVGSRKSEKEEKNSKVGFNFISLRCN